MKRATIEKTKVDVEKFKAVMRRGRWNMSALGNEIGKSPTYISAVLRRERAIPTIYLDDLCKAMGCNPEDIIPDTPVIDNSIGSQNDDLYQTIYNAVYSAVTDAFKGGNR